MTASINNKNTTKTGIETVPERDNTQAFSCMALSASIQDLLENVQKETETLETSTASTSQESSGMQVATPVVNAASSSKDVGIWAVAAAMAQLMDKNNELQQQIAEDEVEQTRDQRDILSSRMDDTQDQFEQWKTNFQAQQYAESHKSRWQKFCNIFKTAFDEVLKVIDKTTPAILILDAIETKIEDKCGKQHLHLFQLESLAKYAQEGMAYANEGISAAAKFLSAGDPKWEKAWNILLPAIITVAATVATMGTATGEVVAGEVAEATVNTVSAAQKVLNAVKTAASAISNMTRGQSLRLFVATTALQETNFPERLAKVCTSDPQKQMAIQMAFETTLSLLSTFSGAKFAGSFLPEGTLFTPNMYKVLYGALAVETTASAVGSIGVGKCDIDLAGLETALASIEQALSMNATIMETTEQGLQQLQSSLSGLLSSLGDNITSLGKAMPTEITAVAKGSQH